MRRAVRRETGRKLRVPEMAQGRRGRDSPQPELILPAATGQGLQVASIYQSSPSPWGVLLSPETALKFPPQPQSLSSLPFRTREHRTSPNPAFLLQEAFQPEKRYVGFGRGVGRGVGEKGAKPRVAAKESTPTPTHWETLSDSMHSLGEEEVARTRTKGSGRTSGQVMTG